MTDLDKELAEMNAVPCGGGCGRVALDDRFYDDLGYWTTTCAHGYSPGDIITCSCPMLCSRCAEAAGYPPVAIGDEPSPKTYSALPPANDD